MGTDALRFGDTQETYDVTTVTVQDHHDKPHAVTIPEGWREVPGRYAPGWEPRVGDCFLDINVLTRYGTFAWHFLAEGGDINGRSFALLIRQDETEPNVETPSMIDRANAPAFPVPTPHSDTGLTVREWLAGQAMQGLLCGVQALAELDAEARQVTALLACAQADEQLRVMKEAYGASKDLKRLLSERAAFREVTRIIADLDMCEGYSFPDSELPKLWIALTLARDAMRMEEQANG